MLKYSNDIAHPLAEKFIEFVKRDIFPCVGAKAALQRGGMRFVVARDFRSGWDDLRIMPALLDLAQAYRSNPQLFQSLVVIFEDGAPDDELMFEKRLWARLQSLADKDEWLGQPLDERVANKPDDPHFGMSFGGEGFFVVGLHPRASRPARRFERPVMVFNLHDQFEQLRTDGRYGKLRDTILERDFMLAGSSNPMLAAHGSISAARQYSGRAVGAAWQCPFTARATS